jgi:hypothetical protein
MAEVLLAVGGVASFLQIARTLTSLTKELKQCIRILRYAPKEVKQLRHEMWNFSLNLQWFDKLANECLEEMEGSPEKVTRLRQLDAMLEECKTIVNGFKKFLRRFFVNKSQRSSFEVFADRIRWYFRQSQVIVLRLALESTKSSISLFTNLLMLEALVKKIAQLERALQKVPRELKERM